jgi:hypothetical protein
LGIYTSGQNLVSLWKVFVGINLRFQHWNWLFSIFFSDSLERRLGPWCGVSARLAGPRADPGLTGSEILGAGAVVGLASMAFGALGFSAGFLSAAIFSFRPYLLRGTLGFLCLESGRSSMVVLGWVSGLALSIGFWIFKFYL